MQSELRSIIAIWVVICLTGCATGSSEKTEPPGSPDSSRPVDFGLLLNEMHDLSGLAQLPAPDYTTTQFSSFDRRSTSPEEPEWYSNADGFGQEPVPGFLEVLGEPDAEEIGCYLVADVDGPGAIVRTWSAGMGGQMDVYLDGLEAPLFSGDAYAFLARKSEAFLERAGLDLDAGDAFCQQDADYMPIPFSKSLRITWKGNLQELHFYHIEVRTYPDTTRVVTFDPDDDLNQHRTALETAVEQLTRPAPREEGERFDLQTDLLPDEIFEWSTPQEDASGAITELVLNLTGADESAGADLKKILRGTVLRIAFDGAHKPQVDSPAGDFFGTGVGLNPFDSLPMSVAKDGAMTCRFAMPFQKSAEITLFNSTDEKVRIKGSVRIADWTWDERSLYFRAKWRTDHLIDLRFGPFDMPYIVARGQGRFVGAACMLVNPSPFPHPYGSWWGEGDEKIFVDDEPFPCFYGTGSEDYYNYSWSRPDLFEHPYCGQPLDSGPGNQGYCSNHRWHILDALSFNKFFAFYMEVWHHFAKPGLCYSCIAYLYARPGMIDDHRRVQRSELFVQDVPSMEPEADYGARGATFLIFEDHDVRIDGGAMGFDATQPSASQGRLLTWRAEKGDRLLFPIEIEEDRDLIVNVVAAHWPESGSIRISLNDVVLTVDHLGGAGLGETGQDLWVLKSPFARRLLSTRFKKLPLNKGTHTLVFECVEPGLFGFDYLWIK